MSARALVVLALILEACSTGVTYLPTPAINPASFVDVIVVTGQSNASGQAVDTIPVPPGFFMWPHVIGVHAPVGLEALGPYTGTTHGIELDLATFLASQGCTPFIFKVSQGATGLNNQWLPPSAPDWLTLVSDWAIVQPLLAAQYPGKTFRFHHVILNGETECTYLTTDPRVASFAADMATLVAGLRSTLGDGGAYIMRQHTHFPPATYPSDALVQTQFDMMAISNSHIYHSETWPVTLPDALHYIQFRLPALSVATDILTSI